MKARRNGLNLMTLMAQYGSEDRCREYLESLRWPQGVKCPRCQGTKFFRLGSRPQYDCASCGYQFSVTVGTIFHDSHLPLSKWLAAVFLMCESKKGISANQMKRMLGVSYKTAWYLCHRIRAAMKDANPIPLSGIVEVDETYFGGKKRGVGSGGYHGLTPAVVGAVQRGGLIRVKKIQRADKRTLHGFIKDVTLDETQAIYTDEADAYKGIADHNTKHETVRHSLKEWVRADVHTNTVEGVWSLFKRSLVGSWHQLSGKHLPAYLDEMAFRFNNRHNPYLFRDTLLKLLEAPVLPFRKLVIGTEARN